MVDPNRRQNSEKGLLTSGNSSVNRRRFVTKTPPSLTHAHALSQDVLLLTKMDLSELRSQTLREVWHGLSALWNGSATMGPQMIVVPPCTRSDSVI